MALSFGTPPGVQLQAASKSSMGRRTIHPLPRVVYIFDRLMFMVDPVQIQCRRYLFPAMDDTNKTTGASQPVCDNCLELGHLFTGNLHLKPVGLPFVDEQDVRYAADLIVAAVRFKGPAVGDLFQLADDSCRYPSFRLPHFVFLVSLLHPLRSSRLFLH